MQPFARASPGAAAFFTFLFSSRAAHLFPSHPPSPPPLFRPLTPVDLLNFSSNPQHKQFMGVTSVIIGAAGVGGLMLDAPTLYNVASFGLGVLAPLHAHVGMRSVILDYVHDDGAQKTALMAMAGVTVATVAGLTIFNATDVGVLPAVKALFVKQELA